MLCYRDRTFCQTPSCGNPDCDRILTPEHEERAKRLGLPVAYAVPCLSPTPDALKGDAKP